jgi:hypothetical protein
MPSAKTLAQREKELQSLLATSAGRKELGELESRYREVSGRLRPASTSIITYILAHEREAGPRLSVGARTTFDHYDYIWDGRQWYGAADYTIAPTGLQQRLIVWADECLRRADECTMRAAPDTTLPHIRRRPD